MPARPNCTPRPVTVKEFDLIVAFDRSHLGGDAGLTDVEPLRGAAEATFGCNRKKSACLCRCHRFFLYLRRGVLYLPNIIHCFLGDFTGNSR